MTRKELKRRVEVAKAAPGMAHLILSSHEDIRCRLCGKTEAPIVGGKHLSRKWCRLAKF